MQIVIDTNKIANFITSKAKVVGGAVADGTRAVKNSALEVAEASRIKKLEAVAADEGLPSEIRAEAKEMASKLKAAYDQKAKDRRNPANP